MNLDTPPSIQHIPYRPTTHYIDMARDAGLNMHTRENARKLLELYADCANEFRPSAKFISDRINAREGDIQRIRQQLQDRGLIVYDKEMRRIDVQWDIIRAAALYGPISHAKDNKHGSSKHIKKRPIKSLSEYKSLQIAEYAPLTDEQLHLYESMENMSEEEYTDFLNLSISEYGDKYCSD